MTDQAAENTDRELWRETPDDYYAASIHVTKEGGIGINVGGIVFVMDVRDWHNLAVKDCERGLPRPHKTWCPFCNKSHVGGDTCMGHHP